jgi:uncharacterized protein (DUF2336 family)
MIVRQFLQWIRTAPSADRADAASALVRAYLYSDLSPDDRAAAEGALLLLLDDASPIVRLALAEAIAPSDRAPLSVVHGLAADQLDISVHIFQKSPLLTEGDLVDAVAGLQPVIQATIADRAMVQRSVAAALAEVGSAEACLILLENPGATLVQFALDRIVARHGHLAAIRETLLGRDDLPVQTRQALVAKLSQALAGFVAGRAWLDADRAQRVTKEACEKATVTLAADSTEAQVSALIRRLRESEQLTAGLLLRALLCGNAAVFEEALSELSGMPIARVCGLVYAKGGAGLRAVFDKAGLPPATFSVFREAVEALREHGASLPGPARLNRRMVEHVLMRCEDEMTDDVDPLLTLLRRFAAEAARDEARMFCDRLTADDAIQPPVADIRVPMDHRIAA